MPTLTVHFQYMFMLVNHPRGSVVLLPSAGHCATLTVDEGDPIPLSGCQVNLMTSDGRAMWGTPPASAPATGTSCTWTRSSSATWTSRRTSSTAPSTAAS